MYSAVSRIQVPTGEWQGNLNWRISVLSGVLPPFWTEDHLQTSGKAWSASREQVTNMERQSPGFLIKSTLKLLGERKREQQQQKVSLEGAQEGTQPDCMPCPHVPRALLCPSPSRQAGRQAGRCGRATTTATFRTLETSVRGKPDRHRAHSPAAPRPSTTGPRFPLWGEPRSPRDATGGSRDGRQPHGARSLGGRLPLGRPEAGPPPPRVVSPRPCPPRGPRPLPSSVPGFLAAMPRATGGSPARLRPPRSRPAAAGSGGDTGRAAPGRAVPCPGEAVSPGSRGGKPDCPPCFKRRRQMPPRCPR